MFTTEDVKKKSTYKKLLSVLLIMTFAISLLAGCGNKKEAATPTQEAEAADADNQSADSDAEDKDTQDKDTEEKDTQETGEATTLRIVAFNNMIAHVDSIVAKNAGLYEENGIKPEFTFNNSNPDNIQMLLQGKVDLVSAGATAVLQYIDQGSDIVIIGGQMSSGETLYCLPEREKEFAELNEETLKGKKVGVSRMNTGDIVFRKILKDKGVDLSTIEFVELDSQATVTQAVASGEVDLGINFLTYRDAAEQQGLVPLTHFDGDDEWPGFICCRMFTTRKNLEANRDAYKKAVKANIEAYALIQEDPDTAVKYALQDLSIDESTLRKQLFEYGHVGIGPNPDRKNTADFYQAMVDIGYSKGAVDINDYIDTSLYTEALQELIDENPDSQVYKDLWEESESTNS